MASKSAKGDVEETREDIEETLGFVPGFLSSWTARYSAIVHGMDYDTFEDEFGRIAEHLEARMAADD